MNLPLHDTAPALLTAEAAAALAGVSHATIVRSPLPRYRTQHAEKTRTFFHCDDVAAFRGNRRKQLPAVWPSQQRPAA